MSGGGAIGAGDVALVGMSTPGCQAMQRNHCPAVADDGAGRIEAASGQFFDLLAPEAVDPAQLQAHRLSLGRGFDGGDDWRLAGRAAAALPPERSPPR